MIRRILRALFGRRWRQRYLEAPCWRRTGSLDVDIQEFKS